MENNNKKYIIALIVVICVLFAAIAIKTNTHKKNDVKKDTDECRSKEKEAEKDLDKQPKKMYGPIVKEDEEPAVQKQGGTDNWYEISLNMNAFVSCTLAFICTTNMMHHLVTDWELRDVYRLAQGVVISIIGPVSVTILIALLYEEVAEYRVGKGQDEIHAIFLALTCFVSGIVGFIATAPQLILADKLGDYRKYISNGISLTIIVSYYIALHIFKPYLAHKFRVYMGEERGPVFPIVVKDDGCGRALPSPGDSL